jgi:ribonuclease R
MRGERTGVTYKMGDTVEVKLVEAAPVTGGLRFELAGAEAATPHRRHPKPDKKTRFKPKRR